MTTARTREPEMGLTFEKVWAMFQESDRRMQKMKEETCGHGSAGGIARAQHLH
ncbi:MAG: hypothetical protein LBL51_03010 [Synergistaceae bacterium]|jgi:hypothetical protein|nr:hypothetical protein [Synergistaceae bacterium]